MGFVQTEIAATVIQANMDKNVKFEKSKFQLHNSQDNEIFKIVLINICHRLKHSLQSAERDEAKTEIVVHFAQFYCKQLCRHFNLVSTTLKKFVTNFVQNQSKVKLHLSCAKRNDQYQFSILCWNQIVL